MVDGEMAATNSTIDINPHGEIARWLNGAMGKWLMRHSSMVI